MPCRGRSDFPLCPPAAGGLLKEHIVTTAQNWYQSSFSCSLQHVYLHLISTGSRQPKDHVAQRHKIHRLGLDVMEATPSLHILNTPIASRAVNLLVSACQKIWKMPNVTLLAYYIPAPPNKGNLNVALSI